LLYRLGNSERHRKARKGEVSVNPKTISKKKKEGIEHPQCNFAFFPSWHVQYHVGCDVAWQTLKLSIGMRLTGKTEKALFY
jgi:hypothetical protein